MTLKDFFESTVENIAPADRYNTITEIDDVIVVNFDCLFERECNLRSVDQLLFLLHKIGADKKFIFISEDGANIRLSGAINVINNIIKVFNLNNQTCLIVCREQLVIENAEVIIRESVDYWCRVLYEYIKDIPIPQGQFNKKFAAWFNRGTVFRLDIARHLLTHHANHSILSYQEPGIILDRKLTEYFPNEIGWANTNAPVVYDQLFPKRVYNYELIVGAGRKPYNDYFIEIVVETDILTTDWITEKTIKNLYIGKPFIIMAAAGALAKIRSRGFKTFSPWIDESYDTIENISDRLTVIKQEIDRLATLDLNELHKEIVPILEHNRETYGKYINSR